MLYLPHATFLLSFLVSASTWWEKTNAHGYLQIPRARNLLAHDLGIEYDHMSLNNNLGDGTFSSSVCGQVQGGGYDYDVPRGIINPDNIASYSAGQIITVDVALTAHHYGHFEFSICDGTAESCFRSDKLEIVSDNNYNAPIDTNYPERAMIPPSTYPMQYSYQVKLPETLTTSGDGASSMILHWTYITANSCRPAGYDVYPFPAEWNMPPSQLGVCGPYNLDTPPGVPEVFYNCADVLIEGNGGGGLRGSSTPTVTPLPPSSEPPASTPAPVEASIPSTPAPTPSPPTVDTDYCGDGSIGNGICQNPNHCCSQWGWCGTSDAHCDDNNNDDGGTNDDTNNTLDPCSTATRCGSSWTDANTKCGEVCNGTWNDCSDPNENCYGGMDLSVCAANC